jgi:hypothetical protein
LNGPAGSTRSSTKGTGTGWRADGDRVRLITKGGYNFTDRYQWIVEAARKVHQTRFVIDGEAVVLGVDGIAYFDALHLLPKVIAQVDAHQCADGISSYILNLGVSWQKLNQGSSAERPWYVAEKRQKPRVRNIRTLG